MFGSLPSDGWYCNLEGQTFGPLSRVQVQELLLIGRLGPRQVMWNRGPERLFYLRADTLRSQLPLPVNS